MLQPPSLKDNMKTVGIDQSLSKIYLFEHRCIKNIKKLYKYAWKCDDQQQFKDILDATMVSNPE